jgi:hypothetical protein
MISCLLFLGLCCYIYIAELVKFLLNSLIVLVFGASTCATAQVMVLESEDFRLHYPAEDSLEIYILDSLFETSLMQLQKDLNYYTNKSIDVFFHRPNTLSTMNEGVSSKQTNEGVIRLSPLIVSISLDSDVESLRFSFRSQVAQLLVEEMLYGGNFQDKIKSANLVNLPDWVLPGLYHYLGSGWSVYDDNSWRAVYEQHGFKNLNSIPLFYSDIKGASFWKYIHNKYGEKAVPSLLYMMRLTRKMNSAIFYAFKKSMYEVSHDWASFYKNQYVQDQNRLSPLGGIKLNNSIVRGIHVVADTLFYTFEKTITGYAIFRFSGGDFVKTKVYSAKSTLAANLVPSSFYATVNKVRWILDQGSAYIDCRLDISSDSLISRDIKVPFKISFVKLDLDSTYLVSSSWNASSVYSYFATSHKIFAVRGFISSFDERDGSVIASVQKWNDFAVLHKTPQGITRILLRSQDMLSDVVFANDSTVLFNAGADGIINGKVLNLNTQSVASLTNYRYNIASHQYNQNVFVERLNKGNYAELFITDYLPVHKLYDYDTIYPTADFSMAINTTYEGTRELIEELPDSLLEYTFQQPVSPASDYDACGIDSLPIKVPSVDVNEPRVWQNSEQMLFSQAYLRLTNTSQFVDQSVFTEAIPLQLPSQINLDVGFSLTNKGETRRFTFGASGLLQTGAFDVYTSFRKQSKWVRQFDLINRRRASLTPDVRVRFLSTIGRFSFTMPILFNGLTFSHKYSLRHDQKNNLVLNSEALSQIGSNDPSLIISQASIISFHKHWLNQDIDGAISIGPSFNGLTQKYSFTTDFNWSYLRQLNPQVVFKTRGRFINSFGSAPQFFMLGGLKSDLRLLYFNRNYSTYRDPMLYTSLFGVRGFPLNYRNGNTATYANIQLDWKFLKSLVPRPIVSEFFANISLRSFIDVGTSYYGRTIFDNANVLNQSSVATETGSIVILVNAFKNPFIGSAGLGFGSRVFGYMVSLDAAIGYESQVINEPMFHLNIGHIF